MIPGRMSPRSQSADARRARVQTQKAPSILPSTALMEMSKRQSSHLIERQATSASRRSSPIEEYRPMLNLHLDPICLASDPRDCAVPPSKASRWLGQARRKKSNGALGSAPGRGHQGDQGERRRRWGRSERMPSGTMGYPMHGHPATARSRPGFSRAPAANSSSAERARILAIGLTHQRTLPRLEAGLRDHSAGYAVVGRRSCKPTKPNGSEHARSRARLRTIACGF